MTQNNDEEYESKHIKLKFREAFGKWWCSGKTGLEPRQMEFAESIWQKIEIELTSITKSPTSQNEQQEAVDVKAFMQNYGTQRATVQCWKPYDDNFYTKYTVKAMLEDITKLYTSPPKQAIPEESAWLIEKYINGKLHYAYCDEIGILDWTSDSLAAMRFSRKQDAAQLTSIMEDADRVAEHMWAAPTNTEAGND